MATLKDIAKQCGVSIGSVSRVLNNDKSLNISDKVRQQILSTAKKLNYKLPKKRNKYRQPFQTTIGIIHWYNQTREIDDPYYEEIRMGIQSLAHMSNVRTILKYKVDEEYELEGFENIDGLICIGKFSQSEIKQFHEISKKIVFVDFSPDENEYDSIVIDFEKAVKELLQLFVDRGFQKIGYIGGREFVDKNVALGERREMVFKEFLTKNRLINEKYILIGTFSNKSGYQLMKEALEYDDYASLYFCANDSIAMGALRAIYEKGLRVPEDIKIVGFNDNKSSAYLSPPLSTIHVPTTFMGEQALLSVLEQIEGRTMHLKKIIPTRLVIRESFK